MSELQLIFLILACIYAWECSCWVRRGSVAFRTWLGRRWRAAHPAGLLGNSQAGVVIGHPLPPLGWLVVGTQFPLSLSPEAVLAFVAPSVNPGWRPTQSGKCFRWSDIKRVKAEGRKVLISGELLLKAPSTILAGVLATKLSELSKLPQGKRAEALQEMIGASLDTKSVERTWKECHQQLGGIRLLQNILLGYLFVLAPIVIWYFGLQKTWLPLVIGLLSLTGSTAWLFRSAHIHFFPAAGEERFTHFLTILLSPATTLRAHDVLSRHLLESFHPLALAKVFCSPSDFQDFAQNILRELRHPGLPLCPREEPLAQAAERYHRAALLKAAENFLKKSGLNPGELLTAPEPADVSCRSFCPRCLSQFTTSEGTCPDCGGIELVGFSKSPMSQS